MIGAKGKEQAMVAVIMGSDSDFSVMRDACEALDDFGIRYEKSIVSAHRTPEKLQTFATGARAAGIRVIIAGAGGAAHLPGMVAAFSELPVIGVPIPIGALQGEDALLSIVQMPKGVPVATVAIGGAYNAGVLAAQILGTGDPATLDKVRAFKNELRAAVESKKLP